jgi:dimethylargininase
MAERIALVRPPSPRMADGLVTHIERTPVDAKLAERQHEAYVDALEAHGWTIREVPLALNLPDSAFVEDTVVVVDRLAVLTNPGAPERQAEVKGTEEVIRALRLDIARIEPPGTLDGGDVLQVGSTVYVGRGGRTNDEGIRQLADHLQPLNRTVVTVPLKSVLHLKSAITALPDGTIVGADPTQLDATRLPPIRRVVEPGGSHVVVLDDHTILMATSAPQTKQRYEADGLDVVAVDISEFEKMEGCVTCLSVLVPGG